VVESHVSVLIVWMVVVDSWEICFLPLSSGISPGATEWEMRKNAFHSLQTSS